MKPDIVKANAATLISIGEKIIQYHTSNGPTSPLSNIQVAELNTRISNAKQKHAEGMKYKKLMEDAFKDRDYYLDSKAKGIRSILKTIDDILRKENIVLRY